MHHKLDQLNIKSEAQTLLQVSSKLMRQKSLLSEQNNLKRRYNLTIVIFIFIRLF